MTDQHPITPPPELVREWQQEANHNEPMFSQVAIQAARWGADQELEACCMWITREKSVLIAEELGIARRPKPPSLKEQALDALREAESTGCLYVNGRSDLIRRALEALPND